MEPFLEKLEGSDKTQWTGPLSFLEKWESPYTDPENQMEQITPSGADDATAVGKHLLHRYPKLATTARKVYVDKKPRTQDTAMAFIKAFPQAVEVVQIQEDREFHATIPHKYYYIRVLRLITSSVSNSSILQVLSSIYEESWRRGACRDRGPLHRSNYISSAASRSSEPHR